MGGILRVRVLAAAIGGYEIGRAFFPIRLPNRRQTLRHLAPRLCGYFPGETSRFGWRPLVGYQHGQIGEARHASGRHGRSQALANARLMLKSRRWDVPVSNLVQRRFLCFGYELLDLSDARLWFAAGSRHTSRLAQIQVRCFPP